MTEVLNDHCPEETKLCTIRPRYPWFNDTISMISEQSRLRRKYERKWRKVAQSKVANEKYHAGIIREEQYHARRN